MGRHVDTLRPFDQLPAYYHTYREQYGPVMHRKPGPARNEKGQYVQSTPVDFPERSAA